MNTWLYGRVHVPERAPHVSQHYSLLVQAGQKERDLDPIPQGKAVLWNTCHCPKISGGAQRRGCGWEETWLLCRMEL